MRRLRVTIVDLVTRGPSRAAWGRLMLPNFASVMPQVLGVWCEEAGHDVHFVCYTGQGDLDRELSREADVVFVAAYTQTAFLAYAIGNLQRARGAVTVIGGPHARCYPEDAARHFDYVLGFTDRALVRRVLEERAPRRSAGQVLTSAGQPSRLPGVERRWRFIEPTLARTPVLKMVPMLGSLGCPYTCPFCVDATVDYRPLEMAEVTADLRFLLRKRRRSVVAWHDPNFGVRFDEVMHAIEEAAPAGRIDFLAESSLSILSEPRLRRLQANGFRALLPGVESWFDLGGKSKTGASVGLEKVRQVSEHVRTIERYVPYVQANFVLGLDGDHGDEPFELTRRFVDRTPGVFPAFSMLTAFGRGAPLNLELQRAGRVLPTPFPFLDNNRATNVRPLHYSWPALYDQFIALREHAFSWRAIGRRMSANAGGLPRWLNVVRAVSSEGFGRLRHDRLVRRRMDEDAGFRRFLDGETTALPRFYVEQLRSELGPWWDALPPRTLDHDPNAYLKEQDGPAAPPLAVPSEEPSAAVTA